MTKPNPRPGDLFLHRSTSKNGPWNLIVYVTSSTDSRGLVDYSTYDIKTAEWWGSGGGGIMKYEDYFWLQKEGYMEFIGSVDEVEL